MDSVTVRLLKSASNPALPFAALPAITQLKQHLDELEASAIRIAREKGASWEQIATALGVTRQAVQQRMQRQARAAALGVGSNDGNGGNGVPRNDGNGNERARPTESAAPASS